MLRHFRHAAGVVVAVAAALAVLLLQAVPAGAIVTPGPPPGAVRAGSNTELTLTSLGNGQAVNGFIANPDNPFDPVTDGYPSNPTTGFTPKSESFAGVIFGTPVGGGAPENLYCIDIDTNTYIGFGYQLGTWDAANVGNVGYVARLLNGYYPNTNEPAGLTNLDQKAAAVQAAVWFFSDRYVLNTSDPLHNTVVQIVNDVIAAGPLVQPPPPSLTITPTARSGPAGSVIGPFTVASTDTNSPTVTVTATGATMWRDAGATMSIANGDTVPSGAQIWLKSTGTPAAVLQATAQATVPSGNVYLYDGNSSPNAAQKLILAQTTTLNTTVHAAASFQAPGSLVVSKIITGPASGLQGAITIHTVCAGTALSPDFIIPANAVAGTQFHTYNDLAAGAVCTVTETVNGATSTVSVVVVGSGSQVMVPTGASVTASLTDTYTHITGELVVAKTITGPAAGQQGAVTIHTVCNGTALTPDFTIPANTAAGTQSHTYNDLAAGAACTITETANGATSTVSVVVAGIPQTVTIPAATIVQANITDTYDFVPGSLVVTKTITGPAAGQQGAITIHTVCGTTALTPDLTIPANTAAGAESQTYSNLAAGARCTVTETVDGSSSTVAVVVAGSGQLVTIPPGGAATAALTDTYTLITGELVVNKTITGPAAGQQGAVTIHTVCATGPPTPDFTIPAGTGAGTLSQTYTNLPAGDVCTITETVDGSSSTVSVVVASSPQTVTIPAATIVEADITDTYNFMPGSLVINKTITGSGAGQQGPITITVTCNGTALTPLFTIPGGTAAGTVSQRYTNIPANSVCTVIENPDGSTSTLSVIKAGSGTEVTIPPGAEASADLTDTYETGSLVINKTITGEAAGDQGPITIHTVCGTTALTPDFTIPAGTGPGTRSTSYGNILAGSSCTVTETANGVPGATVPVTVATTISPQPVTIAANGSGTADVSDTYTRAPGELTVTKTIAGTAAGQQGAVLIRTVCNGVALTPDFTVAAGTAAGNQSQTYTGIAAGSNCIVVELVDGRTTTVRVTVTGRLNQVTIPAGATATVAITDTYSTIPGALLVGKIITGPAAGQQGAVTIEVTCGTTSLPDFTIPAGAAAGLVPRLYLGIPAGSMCTISETANGATSTVTVTVVVDPASQPVTVPAARVVPVGVTDTYDFVPGSLVVTKTIAGPAAGQQGDVLIRTVCDGVALTPDFTIDAGTAAGDQSLTYEDIAAGSNCTVVELVDGHTTTVNVTVTGPLQPVTISPATTSTVTITDTYTLVPGALLVSKTITGSAAGLQEAVTIGVTCGTTPLPDFTIPAGAPAGTLSQLYSDIPAGSMCTITETADGATSTVTVTVDGSDQIATIPAATIVPVEVTDTYADAPGSLTVTKTLAGAAAGQQGGVAILVLCGGPISLFAFLIPPAAPAGPVPRSFDGIPAGSTCTVIEVIDGTTETVSVAGVGSGQQVSIPPGGVATASLTDTFTAAAVPEATPAPITEATETLAVTGAGQVGRLLDLAVGAIAIGAVMSVMSGRRRLRRPKGHHFKR